MLGGLKQRENTQQAAALTGAAWRQSFKRVFGRKNGLNDQFWDDLEEALIVSDVGVATTVEMLKYLKGETDAKRITDAVQVRSILRAHVVRTFRKIKHSGLDSSKPTILLVVGVNGVGKTTSIAKLAFAAKSEGRRVVLAAADTFRSGAIEQLRFWGAKLDLYVVSQQTGSDSGAVAFDAVSAAKARQTELLIIDTAGRLHTSHNLMEELKKIKNIIYKEAKNFVIKVLLVIDGNTGQNGISQAKYFTEALQCDGVMITKLDGTAKGGVALAISGELELPIWFAGTGEKLEDLSMFDPQGFADEILPEPIKK